MRTLILVATLLSTSATFAGNRESGGRFAAKAVYVNFMSFGTGIDGVTLKVTEDGIKQLKKERKVEKVVRKQQGREGERMVCVLFKDATDRAAFIKDITPSIVDDRANTPFKRTSVRVGMSCENYNNATEQEIKL